ncbi:MAG TPA: hypothetical protein VK509_05935 [Polyangiales bacterium]|nr:hypothetical protein [Polyangiales bacterium]
MEPTPDPIVFTRERLQEIAVVWIDATKRKLAPLMEKVPAPIARYLKARAGSGDAATPSDVVA